MRHGCSDEASNLFEDVAPRCFDYVLGCPTAFLGAPTTDRSCVDACAHVCLTVRSAGAKTRPRLFDDASKKSCDDGPQLCDVVVLGCTAQDQDRFGYVRRLFYSLPKIV